MHINIGNCYKEGSMSLHTVAIKPMIEGCMSIQPRENNTSLLLSMITTESLMKLCRIGNSLCDAK